MGRGGKRGTRAKKGDYVAAKRIRKVKKPLQSLRNDGRVGNGEGGRQGMREEKKQGGSWKDENKR